MTVGAIPRGLDPTSVGAKNLQQKKKSKPPVDKSRNVILGKHFLTYLRPATFDTEKFKKGHVTMYKQDKMDEHDTFFRNQALFNFDSSHAKLRKATRVSTGRSM